MQKQQRAYKSESELDGIFSATYEELRGLAATVRRDDPSATLNPTALVSEAYLKLVNAPPGQSASRRRAFLEERCDGDSALVDDVLALLEADARGGSLLDRGFAHAAHDVLGASVPVPEAIGP